MEFPPEDAGRRRRCPDCGAPFTVPQDISLADNATAAPPVPAPPVLSPPVSPPLPPVPPPLPSAISTSPSSAVTATPPVVPSTAPPVSSAPPGAVSDPRITKPVPMEDDGVDRKDVEVLSLLAHVYNEAREDARKSGNEPLEAPLPRPAPPPLPPPSRGIWGLITVFLILLLGGVAAFFLIDWKGQNKNLLEARRLKSESEQVLIKSHARNVEYADDLVGVSKGWERATASVDSLIAAAADVGFEILLDDALETAESTNTPKTPSRSSLTASSGTGSPGTNMERNQAFERFRRQRETLKSETESTISLMDQADTAILEWEELRRRSDVLLEEADVHYRAASAEGVDIGEEMRHPPRHPIRMPVLFRDVVADPRLDQTEGLLTDFRFPGAVEDRFFAILDSVHRRSGERALRLTALGENEIVLRYPAEGRAKWSLKTGDWLTMRLRFPQVNELLGNVPVDEDTGKLRSLVVRLGNADGSLRYESPLPRYTESLFYAGYGDFAPLEIPLAGSAEWKCVRERDGIAVRDVGGGVGGADEEFLRQIDWLEIRLVPQSFLTTLWIDELAFDHRSKYALVGAEDAEMREETLRKRRQTLIAVQKQEHHGSALPAVEHHGQAPRGPRLALVANETPGQREQRLAEWVLAVGGKIEVLRGGVLDRHDNRDMEHLEPFEALSGIDLAACRMLTPSVLDIIGTVRELRSLNLADTGLTNAAPIKLSQLNRLEKLDLSRNTISFDEMPHFSACRDTLRELRLDGFRWGRSGLDPIARFTRLRVLSLNGASFDNSDLASLLQLGELESLSLAGTNVSNRATIFLSALSSLRRLDIRDTRINAQGIATLRKDLPSLRVEQSGKTPGGP